jgi:hypothetical protein
MKMKKSASMKYNEMAKSASSINIVISMNESAKTKWRPGYGSGWRRSKKEKRRKPAASSALSVNYQ